MKNSNCVFVEDWTRASRRRGVLLAIILLGAANLRLVGLGRADPVTDEVLYAFRAVGMLDFLEAPDQPTPLEWFDPHVPWWTHLSFHDHPPLVFSVQHLSMKLFGESNIGFRLPSVIAGVVSVFLLFQIGALLYGTSAGIMSAALLAVTANHVNVSRHGLQEAYVICFMLFASYLFLRSLERDRFFVWTGGVLGLSLLTKYTSVVLAWVFCVYLLVFRRRAFRRPTFWAGAALSLLVFSPVILYNAAMYRAVGHFDFQVSYVVRQKPEVWKVTPGKEIGSLGERARAFVPRLIASNSWLFLALLAASGILYGVAFWRAPTVTCRRHGFVLIALVGLALFIIVLIGPSQRFLTMLTPWCALAIGALIPLIPTSLRRGSLAIGILIVCAEALYTVNSVVLVNPVGPAPWMYSSGLHFQSVSWGYNALGAYFAREFRGRMPAAAFSMKYKFLDRLHDEAIAEERSHGLAPYSAVIIHDGDIQQLAQLWILDRLNVYHAWPVANTEQYLEYLRAHHYADIVGGFEHHYFVALGSTTLTRAPRYWTSTARAFEAELRTRGVRPISIKNERGEEGFRIYRF